MLLNGVIFFGCSIARICVLAVAGFFGSNLVETEAEVTARISSSHTEFIIHAFCCSTARMCRFATAGFVGSNLVETEVKVTARTS